MKTTAHYLQYTHILFITIIIVSNNGVESQEDE